LIWTIVPVKDFDSAKQRLAAVLQADERVELAAVMLADVLHSLKQAEGIGRIVLVTKEPRAIALAREIGAEILTELVNHGETQAVMAASAQAVAGGSHAMLVIPGDVPLISRPDVEAILQAGRSSDVVLVPSRDERGTNAVLLQPPDAMALRFGNDSFHPHVEAARARKLRTEVLRLSTLDLDVDTPDDLRELALRYEHAPELAVHSRTAAFLEKYRLKLIPPPA
jgi:2-phospho-L-lactate guanylyltransferase